MNMEINVNSILSFAPQGVRSVCNNPQSRITGIMSISRTSGFQPDILYYGDYGEFLKLDEGFTNASFLLLSSDAVPEDELAYDCNLILLHEKESFDSLIDTISGKLAEEIRLGKISAKMLSIVQEDRDMQKLLDYGFEQLGNPLLVTDISFNYLGGAGINALNDEPAWEYAIANGTFPEYYVKSLLKNYIDADPMDKFKLLLIDDVNVNGLKHKQYTATIVHKKQMIGYMKVLEKNKKLSEFDTRVHMLLTSHMSLILSDDTGKYLFNSTLVENFIEAILRKKLKNPEDIGVRQRLFHLKLFDNLRVITIVPAQPSKSAESVYYQYREFKDFFAGNTVVLNNNHFVVLYDSKTEGGYIPEEFARKFSRMLKDNDCEANISLNFQRLEELYRYYEQTLFCVDVRLLMDNNAPLLYYEEVFDYHMIIHFGKLIDLGELVHPAIKKLMLFDKENKGELINTLFCYMKNQKNIPSTAKAMSLHYNTLKHRIAKIQELASIDFDSDREMFQLSLSEMIIKIKEAGKIFEKHRDNNY